MSHITLKIMCPIGRGGGAADGWDPALRTGLAQERPALTGRDGTICTEHVGFATKEQFEDEIKALLFALATIEPLLMGQDTGRIPIE